MEKINFISPRQASERAKARHMTIGSGVDCGNMRGPTLPIGQLLLSNRRWKGLGSLNPLPFPERLEIWIFMWNFPILKSWQAIKFSKTSCEQIFFKKCFRIYSMSTEFFQRVDGNPKHLHSSCTTDSVGLPGGGVQFLFENSLISWDLLYACPGESELWDL